MHSNAVLNSVCSANHSVKGKLRVTIAIYLLTISAPALDTEIILNEIIKNWIIG